MSTILSSGCVIKGKTTVAKEGSKILRAYFCVCKFKRHENVFRGDAEVEYGGKRKTKKNVRERKKLLE